MSNPLTPASPAAFTGITITDGPGAASMSSLMASLSSNFAESLSSQNNPSPISIESNPTSSSSSKSPSTSSSASSSSRSTSSPSNASKTNLSTTLQTSVSPLDSSSPTTAANPSGTVTNAASNTSGAALTKQDKCTGVSCSSGLQAAIAVPVVAVVLGLLALLFVFRRRRKRRDGTATAAASEKPKKPAQKWTRHLRAFSFDTELLMGGRFSTSNSSQDRIGGSTRSEHNSVRSVQPSLRSIEEVAPPYRAAASHAEGPQMSQLDPHAGVVGTIHPTSTSHEPPPYGSIVGNRAQPPRTPIRDPFTDDHQTSPVEGSPFNDPNEDDTAGSEAASIREAQIGRSLSVMSGGRTIDDVRRST